MDRKNIDRYARELLLFNERVAKETTAKALNRTAKGAELLAKRSLRKEMTIRNKWSVGSIKSTRTPLGRPIDKQFVLVGSLQPYLAKQESGGVLSRTPQGRRITTPKGSREGATAFPRKKVATGRSAPRSIKLGKNPKYGRVKKRGLKNKMAVQHARKRGRKHVYMELRNGRKGIFRVGKQSVVMVHRIMNRQVTLKPRPWFEPAIDTARKAAPSAFRLELQKAIDSSGIFR